MDTRAFQKTVYAYYKKSGRHDLPWRTPALVLNKKGDLDPYRIAVSEIMLQQTQVSRVIEKYTQFIQRFPTVHSLASASLSEVLGLWSGLGYNRRAKFLKQMAETIVSKHGGTFPKTKAELLQLPGIGNYTAGAIAAFAFNLPDVLIETNIRTVFIHHFYPRKKSVTDAALATYIAKTLDTAHLREWYWALMDYGSFLKQNGNVFHRKSAHYVKQKSFIGSRRQVRGAVLRALLTSPLTVSGLSKRTKHEKNIIESVLEDLSREQLVRKEKQKFTIIS